MFRLPTAEGSKIISYDTDSDNGFFKLIEFVNTDYTDVKKNYMRLGFSKHDDTTRGLDNFKAQYFDFRNAMNETYEFEVGYKVWNPSYIGMKAWFPT